MPSSNCSEGSQPSSRCSLRESIAYAQVVALAVLDEGDQVQVLALAAAQQAVRRADEQPDQVDVLPTR